MKYLLFLFALNQSCIQAQIDTEVVQATEKGSSSYFINSIDDTLIFTTGIRSILQDRHGNYWFGSHQEGAARFDGESFTYFTVEDGLSSNQVRTIQEDGEGVIWFGTANGPCSIYRNKIEQFNPDLSLLNSPGPQKKHQVRLVEPWFNASDKPGFYGFDGRKVKFEAFPVEINENSDYPFAYGVTGFSKARADYGWISTYSAVFGYDEKSFKVIDDQYLEFYEGIGGNLHVRSVLEDSKGNLWIGNNGIGVLLYNGNTVINFSDKYGLIDPKTQGGDSSPAGTLEHVFAIFEDKNGNIWFGDRDNGAWRYDGEEMTNFIVDEKLSTQHIWEIYEDANGDLLFAMDGGGVYMFNGVTFDRKF